MLKKIIKEMKEGYIKATPLGYKFKYGVPEPCEYCEYKTMCGIESNPDKIRSINKNKPKKEEAADGGREESKVD